MSDPSTIIPPDFSSEMIAGFLLGAVLVFLAGALLAPGLRGRARQGAILLGLAFSSAVIRTLPLRGAGTQRSLAFATSFFLLASIGRNLVVLMIDVVGARRAKRPTPRIFRDVATGVVYLVVALLALRSVDVEPGSILTTSALLTAVVGLAMQDTLGNLVSGLALQLQRPFDVGDWVEVDNGQQAGRVTEVTWRATTVMTLDQVEVILPNASLAKASIRNYSRPSPVARRRISVNASSACAPHDVQDVLVAAARDVPGVLVTPAAFARTKSFAESSIEYEVLFFIDDFGKAVSIEGAVRDRIYYAFARQGIEMPFPTRTLLMPQVDPKAKRNDDIRRAMTAIRGASLMAPLTDEVRLVLAESAKLRPYGRGEAIVRKGDQSTELFVIERGSVGVELPREGGGVTEVAQLGVGECFGEMGLLTGEARTATVRAKTRCDLVVIEHDAFQTVLASHPEIIEHLGGLLATRQAGLSAAEATGSGPQPPEERSRRLISQIRMFFKLV